MTGRLIALLILCLSVPALTGAALPPPRPDAGIGVLIIGTGAAAPAAGQRLLLYREPGIGRIGERDVAKLPRLPVGQRSSLGGVCVAVLAKRGEWLSIAHDDAGRSAWVERERGWDYLTWEEFLPGKHARLMKGLRKTLLVARSGPEEHAAEVLQLTPERPFRIIQVEGDAAQVLVDLSVLGWIRWRDGDGRLLIVLE
jgi:hypothetical protein